MIQRRTNVPRREMPEGRRLDEAVIEGRKVRVGHPVRVKPPGKNGFDAIVTDLCAHDGVLDGVYVRDPKKGGWRCFRPEHITPYVRNIDKLVQQLTRKAS